MYSQTSNIYSFWIPEASQQDAEQPAVQAIFISKIVEVAAVERIQQCCYLHQLERHNEFGLLHQKLQLSFVAESKPRPGPQTQGAPQQWPPLSVCIRPEATLGLARVG